MSRNISQMDLIALRSTPFLAGMFCLTLATVPTVAQAQNDPVKTASVKTDADDNPSIDEKHPLYIPLQVAYKSNGLLKEVQDYECLFSKRELLGKKLMKTTMSLKFRDEPFSVYLKFIDNNPGREVLYVKGKNNNNLLVREAGFKAIVGTIPLAPNGPDALAENKYPVTSIGLKNMLRTVIKQWESEGKFAGITVQKRPNSKLPTGEVCTVYEAMHDKPFKDFPFHTTRLWVDDESGIAIGIQQLGFPGKGEKEPPLIEEYFYGKLKTNLKFTEADFDKNNPGYSFR
jgi:hypothetical protein